MLHSITELREARARIAPGTSVGFVPTMGYLHEGHLSLVAASKAACELTFVSIYVNPSQFGPNEDLASYPRDLERDLELLSTYGVDYVFFPSTEEIYPEGYKTWVEVSGISQRLCGASRPGHFRGVATIVLKLVNLVQPHSMFMGSKDFQQVLVLKTMLRDLNLQVNLVSCPIIREADGLAMSSRNSYLDSQQHQRALCLSSAIKAVQAAFRAGQRSVPALLEIAGETIGDRGRIDYLELVDPERLEPVTTVDDMSRLIMAVYIDKVRLIDNAALGEQL
ncbi:MAG TPA: pantoate--beta-alanine ligase [Candidatus Cloacimonadota bacterium]|nr:pantoate--beta-alanine ligase [Candidatus Cloacimonadota bacterium]